MTAYFSDTQVTHGHSKNQRLVFVLLANMTAVDDRVELMSAISELSSETTKQLVHILSFGNDGLSTHDLTERLLAMKQKDFKKMASLIFRNMEDALEISRTRQTTNSYVAAIDSLAWHSAKRNLTLAQEKNLLWASAAVTERNAQKRGKLSPLHGLDYVNVTVGSNMDGTDIISETLVLTDTAMIQVALDFAGDPRDLDRAIITADPIDANRVHAILQSGVEVAPLIQGAL